MSLERIRHVRPGPVLISDKASYRKISWILEAARLAIEIIVSLWFDRHFGSIASEVPVKFQSDRTILNTNVAAAFRLCEVLRVQLT